MWSLADTLSSLFDIVFVFFFTLLTLDYLGFWRYSLVLRLTLSSRGAGI